MKSYIMRKYASAKQQQNDTSSNLLAVGTAGATGALGGGYAGHVLGGAAGNVVSDRLGLPADEVERMGGKWRGAGRDYLNAVKKYLNPIAVGEDVNGIKEALRSVYKKRKLEEELASMPSSWFVDSRKLDELQTKLRRTEVPEWAAKMVKANQNDWSNWTDRLVNKSESIRRGSILGALGLGGLSAGLSAYLANKYTKTPQG